MPKGEVYVKTSYGAVTAGEQFTFDGRETEFVDGLEGDTFRDRSLYVYTEVGLTNQLTLTATLPYKRTFIEDQAFDYRTFAFGTAALGLRVGLLPLLGLEGGANALAANVGVNLPTGYTRNFTPSVGSGQTDVQLTLNYGRSFWPLPAYAQVGGGYRLRTNHFGFSQATACQPGQDIDCIEDAQPDFDNELLYAFEVGLTPLEGGVLLQLKGNGQASVNEPTVGFTARNPIPTSQRFFKLGGGLALYPFRLAGVNNLAALGLSVEYYRTIDGRNTLNSRDLFVGIEYRMKVF